MVEMPRAVAIELINSPRLLIVDECDAQWLPAFGPFYLTKKDYARQQGGACDYVHRLIMQRMYQEKGWILPSGCQVDHADLVAGKLYNVRSNLRLTTTRDNTRNQRRRSTNTTGFKGVHWKPSLQAWEAVITVDGQRLSLKTYFDPEYAARVYDLAALVFFGEYSSCNYPYRPFSPQIIQSTFRAINALPAAIRQGLAEETSDRSKWLRDNSSASPSAKPIPT